MTDPAESRQPLCKIRLRLAEGAAALAWSEAEAVADQELLARLGSGASSSHAPSSALSSGLSASSGPPLPSSCGSSSSIGSGLASGRVDSQAASYTAGAVPPSQSVVAAEDVEDESARWPPWAHVVHPSGLAAEAPPRHEQQSWESPRRHRRRRRRPIWMTDQEG